MIQGIKSPEFLVWDSRCWFGKTHGYHSNLGQITVERSGYGRGQVHLQLLSHKEIKNAVSGVLPSHPKQQHI